MWIELFGDDSIEQFSAQKIVCFRTFKANFHHTFHAVLWVTHNFGGKYYETFLKIWNDETFLPNSIYAFLSYQLNQKD